MEQFTTRRARFPERRFSGKDLDRSIPLDPQRQLRGSDGDDLLQAILVVLKGQEHRKRLRRPADELSLRESASTLLANILVAARNRIDPERFVAVSFNRNDYVGSKLSVAAMVTLRDELSLAGLLEGQSGYRRDASNFRGIDHARRTRLRATPDLLQMFEDYDVGRAEVGWRTERDVIVMKVPDHDVGGEPSDVASSRGVLQDVSALILHAELVLPRDAWERVVARYRAERVVDADAGNERAYAGDLTATSLYRSFKGGWDRGGRIYGGWWINLPKAERQNLTIRGAPVVELDYGRLHPTLLFARAGVRLDFDPYAIPGLDGPGVRELGKRTFNRLVNRVPNKSGRRVPFVASAQDRSELPRGLSFQQYLGLFIDRLGPVAPWFGTGVGLQLQREDSDLAVAILQRLVASEIVVLPVHDSFIVEERHAATLRKAMTSVFEERYGFQPLIR